MSRGYSVDYFEYQQKATSWEVVDFKPDEGVVVEEWTNDDLVVALKKAAAKLSYYNAAESDQWERERNSRGAAHDQFYALKKIAEDRGVFRPEDFKHFLV